MLLKMGWAGTGTGLGVSGQGIDKPIDGGAVRDRQDIYKVRIRYGGWWVTHSRVYNGVRLSASRASV